MVNPLEIEASGDRAWAIVRRELTKEAKNVCAMCQQKHKGLHIHHKDGCGLNNERDNLIVLCDSCHKIAHAEGIQDLNLAYIHNQYVKAFPRANSSYTRPVLLPLDEWFDKLEAELAASR